MAGDEIAWFRKPTPTNQAPYDGGTLNLSYQLLDKAIVEGAADESVLVDVRGSWSHAVLLEHVAAFGGALKGLGVLPGDRVLVDLADDRDTVVGLLGAARVGAVTVRRRPGSARRSWRCSLRRRSRRWWSPAGPGWSSLT